tara:strand:- start:26 stop:370 length:345 start_codon:yes stop_codon:yes gene_type:complete
MAHYALIEDGAVIKVIVAEQDFIDTQSGTWIQTSYNTKGGVHLDGGTPLRKNFAGIGDIYDYTRDAFYEIQPYHSWTLNEDTCFWEAPTPFPDDWDANNHDWDEETLSWVKVTP